MKNRQKAMSKIVKLSDIAKSIDKQLMDLLISELKSFQLRNKNQENVHIA